MNLHLAFSAYDDATPLITLRSTGATGGRGPLPPARRPGPHKTTGHGSAPHPGRLRSSSPHPQDMPPTLAWPGRARRAMPGSTEAEACRRRPGAESRRVGAPPAQPPGACGGWPGGAPALPAAPGTAAGAAGGRAEGGAAMAGGSGPVRGWAGLPAPPCRASRALPRVSSPDGRLAPPGLMPCMSLMRCSTLF